MQLSFNTLLYSGESRLSVQKETEKIKEIFVIDIRDFYYRNPCWYQVHFTENASSSKTPKLWTFLTRQYHLILKLRLLSNLLHKPHLSRQQTCWSLRCSVLTDLSKLLCSIYDIDIFTMISYLYVYVFMLHLCHGTILWNAYLFGPKWSINYYYY